MVKSACVELEVVTCVMHFFQSYSTCSVEILVVMVDGKVGLPNHNLSMDYHHDLLTLNCSDKSGVLNFLPGPRPWNSLVVPHRHEQLPYG